MDQVDATTNNHPMQASKLEWTIGSNLTDSAEPAANARERTATPTNAVQFGNHPRNSSTEKALLQSPISPTLPPNFEDEVQDVEMARSAGTYIPEALSDRLGQLAAAAWTFEQDENTDSTKQKKVNEVLIHLERLLRDDQITNGDVESSVGFSSEQEQEGDEDDYIDENQLRLVHDSLQSTVNEMRMRSQEQKHLHSLTTARLDTVTQQSQSQLEQISTLLTIRDTLNLQITDVHTECNGLRRENHILGTENDNLRLRGEELEAHVRALQAEVQRQSVALTAMTSAVTGLEEWLNYNKEEPNNNGNQTPQPDRRHNTSGSGSGSRNSNLNNGHDIRSRSIQVKPRTVVRGIGRFRGRYQVDVDDNGDDEEEEDHHHPYYHDSNTDRTFLPRRNRPSSSPPPPSHLVNGTRPTNSINNYTSPSTEYHHHQQQQNHILTSTSDLQDDVRAWIRGCRDVLECAQAGAESLTTLDLNMSTDPTSNERQARMSNDDKIGGSNQVDGDGDDDGDGDGNGTDDGDEWGEYETAQRTV